MIEERRARAEPVPAKTEDGDVARAGPIEAAAIFAALAAGVTVQDEAGRLIFANTIAARMSGFANPETLLAATPAELLARVELIDEGGGRFAWDRLPGRRLLTGEDAAEPTLVGFRLMPEGLEHWSMVEARPIVEAGGRRLVVNTFHDVTPRIAAERAIRASELRYREMADERRRAEEHAQLLADAALRLDEARSVDEAAGVAAEAPLPMLADWSIVDLLEPDGSLRRAAMAARDPELARLIEPLRDHPGIRGPGHASERAIASREPVLIADARDAAERDRALDPEVRRLVLATGVRSVIAQPLVARGGVIGAIIFAVGGDRRYEPADLGRTAEMARRVGPAIANTLSYASEQRARRSAEELAGRMEQLQAVTRTLASDVESERARLENVLRQMPIGVVLAEAPDGRFAFANDAAVRLSPMPLTLGDVPRWDLAIGYRPDGSLLGPDDWPLTRAMAGEMVENEIVEVEYGDASRRTFSMSAAPIVDRSGRVAAAVITYNDISDRIRSQERERFLARASEVLASSLDVEQTIQTVADLAVPAIADWCAVQMADEEGVPRRIAVAHPDPAKVALAIRLQKDYPTDPAAETGVTAILRHGRSEYVADIPPGVIDAAARDDEHRDMLRALGLRSYIAVPLVASGRIIGVLTLVMGDSGRRLEPDDVAFAENLAARAASAIETARLFREGVRFKRLLDANRDAVLMFDPETGRIDYANQGAADQLGAPVESLIGTLIVDHLDAPIPVADGSEPAPTDLSRLIGPLAGGATDTRTETLRFRNAGGASIPVEVRLQAVAAGGGEPARVLAIARDIRDRIETQEHLRALAAAEYARAAELNAVIRAMGEGVFVCDAAGNVILANPAAENIFPDVDEQTYAEILAQIEDPDRLAPRLGERGGPVELRARGDDERWIELSTWPVAPADEAAAGRHGETIVMLRDVTEQRQRQAVRDTFIGVLSHELRTPVTTIYAGSKVLAGSPDLAPETQREIFADIVGEAERLHRLVEDVIAMTRFGDEEGELGAEPVLLQRVVPTVIRSEESRWPEVDFTVDIPPGLPTVTADPTYVEQVLRNLLSNAAKYGGQGAVVDTRLEADDREVRVRIFDDGPGFPAEEQDRLFELFFRSARTSGKAAGAGIGLFVCARLIRAMDGRIWALNRPEGGAEFGFSLRVMTDDE